MRALTAAIAVLGLAVPANANDSTAELGAGGLVLTRSSAIEMASEDLFISQEEVRVAYKFRNTTDADVESIVAFPMPDIEGSPYGSAAIPQEQDNFLGFTVTVDGKSIEPQLEQRAFAGGIDVTDELRSNGIPLFPFDENATDIIGAKSDALRADWITRGIVVIESYDGGDGMNDYYTPAWDLKSTYWWRMNFPKGKEVDVRHSYTPSVGGAVGLNFVEDGKIGGEMLPDYRSRYCMDESFEAAALKTVADAADGALHYNENWINYILTTGGNWRGSIGKFKLTIDKGDPKALVSFCGENVRKTGPTTFEMTADDFYPQQDLEILILTQAEDSGEE